MIGSSSQLLYLLDQIGRGDEFAFSEFNDLTRRMISAYIKRLLQNHSDAEEVLQDVYRQVWSGAAAFDGGRGGPMTWLHMLARSRSIDTLRRRRRREEISVEIFDFIISDDGEGRQMAYFESQALRNALLQLRSKQRQFIQWAFFDGYSHSEIAKVAKLPLGTVKTGIRTALLELRRVLTPKPLTRPVLMLAGVSSQIGERQAA